MIAVPDADVLIPWAKHNGYQAIDMKSLCADTRVKAMVFGDITSIAKSANLRGFEFIKNIHLEPEVWTTESGELTPTMKMKRNVLKDKYAAVIEKMYAEPPLDKTRAKL